MRKLLVLMSMCLCIIAAHAQNRTITGKVTDEKGLPIPLASVKVKGTSVGVSANEEGVFTLSVPANAKAIIVTSVSHNNQEVTIADKSNFTIVLTAADLKLEEVVVTAMGIKRSKNSLPYSAQQIKGDDVSATRGSNFATALSGKISGLEIRQGNSIGGSTNVVMRGIKSLQGNNQALFVVDGVPVDNTIASTETSTTKGNNNNDQIRGRGGYDYGNGAADINPDDIESINVLKGAAATALYGSRAANGIVMITTKKSKKGLNITVNSGVIVGKIDKKTFPKYQKSYGAGYSDSYQKDGFYYFDVDGDGVKDLVAPTAEDASFGAKFDPNLMVYQWDAFDPSSPTYHKATPWVAAKNDPSTFYETAVSTNNSIFMNTASDKGFFKLGYTNNIERGTLPNSSIKKNIINFGASYNITDRLNVSAAANYSMINGKGRYGTGYSGRNVNQNFRQWYQTNVDIQEQKAAYFRNGQNITWNWKDPSTAAGTVPAFTDNYYWTIYKNFEQDSRSRVFGNVALNYKITDWLNLLGRVTLDTYTDFQEERIAVGSQNTPMYSRLDKNYSETNYDLMANVDKQLTRDLNFKAVAGTNIRRNNIRTNYQTTSGGLIVPDLYSIANSKGTVPLPVETNQPIAVDGYFAGATFIYKDFLTLDGTFRRDRFSTLPTDNNAYNYYGVSGGWTFSHHLQDLRWLSSGKLRLNYATVGNGAPWGSIKDIYDQPNAFGSTILFSLPNTKNNNTLKPELTSSKEIGLEMSFLNSRVGFDATYYMTNTINQIIPAATSTATGFSTKYVNAGTVANKGVELSVYGTPVKTKDFSWNVNVNWSMNKNKVVDLYDKSENLLLGSFQAGITVNATKGQPYGTIQGNTWMMRDPKDPTKSVAWDGSSPKLVKDNGYYATTTTTTNVLGNYNPKWIGGVYNSFRYKNVTLGFLVDTRSGGTVWSLDMFYGTNYTGVYPETAGLNDLGKPVRNSLENGGGRILDGVTADGKVNTQRVVIDANSPAMPRAAYAYDASYVKLRETTITYTFPQKMFNNIRFIKGADFSLVGRNLWLIYKNLPYADPEENLTAGNIQGVQSGAYPTTRSIGVNLKIKF